MWFEVKGLGWNHDQEPDAGPGLERVGRGRLGGLLPPRIVIGGLGGRQQVMLDAAPLPSGGVTHPIKGECLVGLAYLTLFRSAVAVAGELQQR